MYLFWLVPSKVLLTLSFFSIPFSVLLSHFIIPCSGGNSVTICNELDSAERARKKKLNERDSANVIVINCDGWFRYGSVEQKKVRNVTQEGRGLVCSQSTLPPLAPLLLPRHNAACIIYRAMKWNRPSVFLPSHYCPTLPLFLVPTGHIGSWIMQLRWGRGSKYSEVRLLVRCDSFLLGFWCDLNGIFENKIAAR